VFTGSDTRVAPSQGGARPQETDVKTVKKARVQRFYEGILASLRSASAFSADFWNAEIFSSQGRSDRRARGDANPAPMRLVTGRKFRPK
jgi:hypothetical protein